MSSFISESEDMYVKKLTKRFRRVSFVTVFAIGTYSIYRYLLKSHPEFLRKNFTNRFLVGERYEKCTTKLSFKYMRFIVNGLLSQNLLPEITDNFGDILQVNFLGMNLKNPIGLSSGVDIGGTMISNLEKLGFGFVEIGPFADQQDTPELSSELELVGNKKNLLIHKLEEKSHFEQGLIQVQGYMYNHCNSVEKHCYGLNLKISEKSLASVPYLADNFFVNMVTSSANSSDFITINLSSYNMLSINQYKNPEKFRQLLLKIKGELFREIGLNAALEYESLSQTSKLSGLHISHLFRSSTNILKTSRTKLFIRLATEVTDEELQNYIDQSVDSGIIDAIIVGGMIRHDKGKSRKEMCFVDGDDSREVSIELLKKAYKMSKGRIPIISAGGVLTPEDVYERLKLGASLVLLHSAFYTKGPYLMDEMLKGLVDLMKRDNVESLKDITKSQVLH